MGGTQMASERTPAEKLAEVIVAGINSRGGRAWLVPAEPYVPSPNSNHRVCDCPECVSWGIEADEIAAGEGG